MGEMARWIGAVAAREFSGAEAVGLGFVTQTDADPLARANALARAITGRNPHAIRAAKALFARAADAPLGEILLAESLAQRDLLGSPNQLEAVRARMERREPKFGEF
jgi:enoyl-CoA hydratase/carnithine racemase